VKILAWTKCTNSVLNLKIHGKAFTERLPGDTIHLRPVFDWQALSEIDSIAAWAGSALASQSECRWFTMSKDSIRHLRENRFCWWLGESFEAILFCGLINRADWTLLVLDEFYLFCKQTLSTALPIAYRMEALIRAQRGEDELAMKALQRARAEARRLSLLFEIQFSDLLFTKVLCDIVQPTRVSENFAVFGCSEGFEVSIVETCREWCKVGDGIQRPYRWESVSKLSKLNIFGSCI